jgi:tyrosine-protein phosphatase SIW14
MKIRPVNLIGVSVGLLLAALVVLSRRTGTDKELPKFHQVNGQLFRGAQPKKNGFKRLGDLGIKTIVNLRADDGLSRIEEREVRAAGMQYFSVPLNETGRPTNAQVRRAVAILETPENQPVFVHCRLGVDRTGLIIAVYRIAHDGWTSERARAEARHYGMHPWKVGMKRYIHNFYQGR